MALRTILAASALPLVASQNRGSEGTCIGTKFHRIDYDFSDETDENGVPISYSIQVEPEPDQFDCLQTTGIPSDKAVCVGVNTNDCHAAAQVVKINDFLDCEDCFVGLTSDIFYNLTVDTLKLKSVRVGIRDAHLRGKAALHVHKEWSKTMGGTFPLSNNEVKKKIDFTVGHIPVSIKISIPTEIEYQVGLSASADLRFGAELDMDLGDHYLQWDNVNGFGVTSSHLGVTWTPTMAADAQITADVPLTLRSSLKVDFENVIGWNVHVTPSLPLHATIKDHWFWHPEVCLSGEADILMNQDSDLHFELAGYQKTLATFGTKQIYHRHWDNVFEKCFTPPALMNATSV